MEAHLIVEARAGSGKTTTLVGGIEFALTGKVRAGFKPSKEQEAIWKAMKQKKKPQTVLFLAFNRSIAKELQERVPNGCQAGTFHSKGLSILKKHHFIPYKNGVDSYKTSKLIEAITGKDIRELWKSHNSFVDSVKTLVGLCKATLAGVHPDEYLEDTLNFSGECITPAVLHQLIEQYNLEVITDDVMIETADGSEKPYSIYTMVPEILEMSRDLPGKDQGPASIDYDDMIWIPVVNNLIEKEVDMLLVDEAQDLNPSRQRFALSLGKRLILCGDPMQAIYGFTGADTMSMSNMQDWLSSTKAGVKTFPLTYTYRCGKEIVREAQKIVAEFHAGETNPDGQVITTDINGMLSRVINMGNSPMMVCRVNAPLVSYCLRFLAQGIKAYIVGSDIGKNLCRYISKIGLKPTDDTVALIEKVDEDFHAETVKAKAVKFPSADKLAYLQDRRDCIIAFANSRNCITVKNVCDAITEMFQDEKVEDENGKSKVSKGIRLSSVHRSKGLEASEVFILRPELMPHPMAKSKWEKEQEKNLKYVAITRAIDTLIWVQGEADVDED